MNIKLEGGGLRELHKHSEEFDSHFRTCVSTACKDWGYAIPTDHYFARAYERLPEGLRALLGSGLKIGVIIPKGRAFTLKGLPLGKGPYNWFSRGASAKEPTPNWEYFVQAAEFIRFHTLVADAKDYSVTFEDDTMDVAVYKNGRLLVYCEVKEKITQLQNLIKEMKNYESTVGFTAPDRHNDPLRKAKCIVKRRPEYFVGVAIGTRYEYRILYPENKAFQLLRDTVPLVRQNDR